MGAAVAINISFASCTFSWLTIIVNIISSKFINLILVSKPFLFGIWNHRKQFCVYLSSCRMNFPNVPCSPCLSVTLWKQVDVPSLLKISLKETLCGVSYPRWCHTPRQSGGNTHHFSWYVTGNINNMEDSTMKISIKVRDLTTSWWGLSHSYKITIPEPPCGW